MPLHLQHRPSSLDEFFGNEGLKASLRTILAREDRPRAFLFTGPPGTGKTTLARIIAKSWGCGDQDYHELNISDTRGIDDARQLIAQMHYGPISPGGKVKIYCLDEVQSATGNWQDAVLKALEDTPKHVAFILCTTDPQKLKPAIRSRCSTFQTEPLPGPILRRLVRHVLEREKTALPDEALQELVKVSNGSPRQALVVLDQVIDIADDAEVVAAIRRNQPLEATVRDLSQALLNRRPWAEVAKLVSAYPEGTNWEQVRIEVFRYCGAVLLRTGAPQAAKIMEEFEKPMFNAGRAGVALASHRAII